MFSFAQIEFEHPVGFCGRLSSFAPSDILWVLGILEMDFERIFEATFLVIFTTLFVLDSGTFNQFSVLTFF